jgi:small subunit ribosomal protein S1
MADSYDEAGNYIFPEGFDAETNEWLEGFEKQRDEWEARYAEAEAANAPVSNGSSSSSRSEESSSGGTLASDAQLAALREKLAGNA